MYPQSMFEQNRKKYHNFSPENYHFFSHEISQYIACTCLRKANRLSMLDGTNVKAILWLKRTYMRKYLYDS